MIRSYCSRVDIFLLVPPPVPLTPFPLPLTSPIPARPQTALLPPPDLLVNLPGPLLPSWAGQQLEEWGRLGNVVGREGKGGGELPLLGTIL